MGVKITGFDIGENTLKMAYIVGNELKKLASAEMPESMVADGQIVTADAMSAFITETAKRNGIPKGNAALILPPSQVHVRTVTVPVMTESQLLYNLPYEFQDYLTEEKSKYIYDYEVLETISDEEGNPKEMKLFICAVLAETLERTRTIFARAGFKVKVAVPEEFLYAKLFRLKNDKELKKEGACAIIDFGQAETRMHIVLNGEYDNKRTFDMGINDLEQIVADLKFTDIHMAHNYVVSNYEGLLDDPKCHEFYNKIAVEVLKAVNFYNYNNQSMLLNDLYVTGGGAAIGQLVETIQNVTKLNVMTADHLLDTKYASKKPWQMLRAIAVAAEN